MSSLCAWATEATSSFQISRGQPTDSLWSFIRSTNRMSSGSESESGPRPASASQAVIDVMNTTAQMPAAGKIFPDLLMVVDMK